MKPYPLAELNHFTVPRSRSLPTFTSTPSDLILSVLPAFAETKKGRERRSGPSLRAQKAATRAQTRTYYSTGGLDRLSDFGPLQRALGAMARPQMNLPPDSQSTLIWPAAQLFRTN